MGHVLGSTHQLKVGGVKEKIPFSCSEETLRFQHKYKPGHSVDWRYLAPDSELLQTAGTGQVGRPKSSENVPKPLHGSESSNGEYDELVRHMSNLPGFLQQVEKQNSIQERALNFGVLEWKRLEKWKYTERMPRKSPKRASSNSNSISSTGGPPKMSPNLRNQSNSHGRHSTSFYSGKQSLPHGSVFSSPPRKPTSHDTPRCNPAKERRNASYLNEEKYVRPVKSKGKDTCNQEFLAAQRNAIGGVQDHFDQRLQANNRSSETNVDKSKKHNLKGLMSGEQVSSSDLGKNKFSESRANKINSRGKKSEMQSDGEPKFTTECYHAEPQNIVLSVRNSFQNNTCMESFHFMESRASVDGQFSEVEGNRLSDFYSTWEFNSGELSADTSHSCPLPSVATVPTQCAIEQHNSVMSSQAIDLDAQTAACQNVNASISMTSRGKGLVMHKDTTSSLLTEASTKSPACIGKKPIVRGRASSPTHRFSFDLGKVGRSFSFKDNSAPPQLNSADISVKCGKVRPGSHPSMDNNARDRETGSARGRSSPLRRLLDPLLKHKGIESAEVFRLTSKSLYSMTARTTSTKGPSQDRKADASTLQALLQLTLKNGRPCFKLVVDNNEDLLAASVKSLPTSGKSDSCMIYTFYSVHEIKKKSMNWITQGSKSKNCSLGYDIIGQMKISNFYHLKENVGDSGECDATECVLYGVNPGELDKQALEFAPVREVAAIIVKSSIKKLDDGELHGRNRLCKEPEPDFGSAETFDTEVNKKISSISVILPGGVHGIPVKGAPSSLISRWKSGGVCDCGGWDVGCKLQILANHNKSNNTCHAPSFNSKVDRINLFLQSGEQKNKLVFSLKPHGSGLYSLDFDTSISLLEAFATCVAYITCEKFPTIIDRRGQSDGENVPAVEIHERKLPTKLQEQLSAQNISHPCPPLSPAGRI